MLIACSKDNAPAWAVSSNRCMQAAGLTAGRFFLCHCWRSRFYFQYFHMAVLEVMEVKTAQELQP